MSYNADISEGLRKVLDKLAAKDPVLAIAVRNKIAQICACDEIAMKHFKNLVGPMSHLKRVHVGHFVLLFRVEGNTVIFEQFRHHDDAY